MKTLILVLTILFFIPASQAKLLDRILGIIDDQVLTESIVKRSLENYLTRAQIAPFIYTKHKRNKKSIVRLFLDGNIIRSKLNEIGYIVTDGQVEARINDTQKRLRVNRAQLLNFLSSNNMTFDEYFEVIKESIEYSMFTSKIIAPLVAITEQEIKNEFFKRNKEDKSLTFKYELVDFSLPINKMTPAMIKTFRNTMMQFQNTANLPSAFSKVETNVLGDITEDLLSGQVKKLLKITEEGSFTKPFKMNGSWHIFYVKKKDLVESTKYLKAKARIRGLLFEQMAENIKNLWLQREESKHYVKTFL